jgi:hypothetical protein
VARSRYRTKIALLLALVCTGCATPRTEAPSAPPAAATPSGPAIVQPARPQPKEPVAKEPALAPEPVPSKGEQLLSQGVKSYEDGDYRSAGNFLQAALHERLSPSDQASAHKLLAFIACAANRVAACRDEFRKAFAAYAAFDLTPAEAGHPVWGPAFRRVKAEVAARTKKRAP